MLLYADTNIIVRLLAKDDESQKRNIVNAIHNEKIKLLICDVVVIECCWVLKHYYNLTNDVIGNALIQLGEVENINFESEEIMKYTLRKFSILKNVDIVDVFLSVVSNNKGTPVLTYDKDFKKLDCEYYQPDQI